MNQNLYRIRVESANLPSLLFFEKYLNIFSGLRTVRLPKKKKVFTLQKSPFVQSKAKEHFELILYKRLYILDLTFSQLKNLLGFLPSDVVVVVEREV